MTWIAALSVVIVIGTSLLIARSRRTQRAPRAPARPYDVRTSRQRHSAVLGKTLEDGARVEDSVHLRLRDPNEGVVGESLSGFGGRHSSVAFHESGTAVVRASGRPRQGTHGEKEAVQRAASFLCERAVLPSTFTVRDRHDDVAIDEPADCVVVGPNGTVLLRAQVVRGAGGLALRELGRSQQFREATTPEALADLLAATIQDKAGRYSIADKRGTALIVDALDHQLAVATEPVIASLMARHLRIVSDAGFQMILVVGPTQVTRVA